MAIRDMLKGLTKRAQDTAVEHKDQIQEAVEKAEVTADQRTGGKYHDQITNAATRAEAYVDKLAPEEAQKADEADKPRSDTAEPPEKPAQ
jgi:ElaB/YqjD/DUF883 family membrane-anchored ribosome-binding protein